MGAISNITSISNKGPCRLTSTLVAPTRVMLRGPALTVKRRRNLTRALNEIRQNPLNYEKYSSFVYVHEIRAARATLINNVSARHLLLVGHESGGGATKRYTCR